MNATPWTVQGRLVLAVCGAGSFRLTAPHATLGATINGVTALATRGPVVSGSAPRARSLQAPRRIIKEARA
jgi:hypothetical protein